MKNKEELQEILAKKNFRSFWHCFEFLTTASYTPLEAFSISLRQFGEDKVFENVAFIRPYKGLKVVFSQNDITRVRSRPQLIVGVIKPDNKHLTTVYETYQKWFYNEKIGIQADIEMTCDVIEICELTPFIRAYFIELIGKHYGVDVSKLQIIDNTTDEEAFRRAYLNLPDMPAVAPPNPMDEIHNRIQATRHQYGNIRQLYPNNQTPPF